MKCMNEIRNANPPIRPLKIMGDEPVPQITNSVRGAVGNKFVDFLPAEEADFTALRKGADKIDYFDARFENLL